MINLSVAELRAQLFPRAVDLLLAQRLGICVGGNGRRPGRRQKKIEQALFSSLLGALGHLVQFFLADHVDGVFHEVAHHGFHVAAHIADFRVFRSFHLYEGAARQPRQPARNFRLPHAGGPDHQNIFRQNFFRHFGSKLLPAHAIAQRDGYSALGGILPDDVLIELDDDFARRQLVKRGDGLGFERRHLARQIDYAVFIVLAGHSSSREKLLLVKIQISLARRMDSWAISLAESLVCCARARAAVKA